MTGRVYSPESQCKGKLRYSDKGDAKRASKRVERAIGRVHAYRCSHCGWWHLGHKPKHPYDFTKGD